MATQLTTLLTLVALCLFVGIVRGRPSYKNKIPNGHNIPHPCTPNTDWAGVGHWLMGGSGALNPFGEVRCITNITDIIGSMKYDSKKQIGIPEIALRYSSKPSLLHTYDICISTILGISRCRICMDSSFM